MMWLRLSGLVMLPLCIGAAPPPVPGELIVEPGATIDATLEGKPIAVDVQADGFSTLVPNAETIARLGLKTGMFGGQAKVGPVKIAAHSKVYRFAVAGVTQKRRLVWFDRALALRGDAAIGPSALPHPIVTFRLRAPQPGEREYILPMSDKGSYSSLGTEILDGDTRVFVQWDLERAMSLVSAPTAFGLSTRHRGVLAAATGREVIKLGVIRPVRAMTLATPVVVGPLRVTRVLARTSDYGDANALRSEDDDPDEILVTANTGKGMQLLRIGRDDMARCSAISFDKPRREIRLRCRD